MAGLQSQQETGERRRAGSQWMGARVSFSAVCTLMFSCSCYPTVHLCIELFLFLPRTQQGRAFQEETWGEEERAGGQTSRAQSRQRSSQTGRTQTGLTWAWGGQRSRKANLSRWSQSSRQKLLRHSTSKGPEWNVRSDCEKLLLLSRWAQIKISLERTDVRGKATIQWFMNCVVWMEELKQKKTKPRDMKQHRAAALTQVIWTRRSVFLFFSPVLTKLQL